MGNDADGVHVWGVEFDGLCGEDEVLFGRVFFFGLSGLAQNLDQRVRDDFEDARGGSCARRVGVPPFEGLEGVLRGEELVV